MNIQIAILAGGMGTRLRELTKNKPKSLIEINHKPFLAYQLEFLKANDITDIVLCIGHLGIQIRDAFGDGSKYGVRLRYSLENRPLGTAGALKNAESLLNNVFFVMYGDSYLFLSFKIIWSYFMSQDRLGLATVYKNRDLYDISNMIIDGNKVLKYSKTEKTKDMVYIDYGASILRKEALQLVPENSTCDMEELYGRLIERGELLAYEVESRFYEIGSPQGFKDFAKFTEEIKNR